MPVEIVCEVKPYGLVPDSHQGQEQLRLFAVGSTVKARLVKSKSRPLLRFYFAVVDEVAKAIGYGKEQLSHELLCRLRKVDAYHCKDGSMFVIPKSIAKMDHDVFLEYVKEVMPIIFGEYVAPESKPATFRIAEKNARTSYREAMGEAEQ